MIYHSIIFIQQKRHELRTFFIITLIQMLLTQTVQKVHVAMILAHNVIDDPFTAPSHNVIILPTFTQMHLGTVIGLGIVITCGTGCVIIAVDKFRLGVA